MPRKAPPPPEGYEEAREEHRTVEIVHDRYKVVGRHDVLGVKPGDIVEVEIPAAQLAVLLGAGHLEKVVDEEPRQESPVDETGQSPVNQEG